VELKSTFVTTVKSSEELGNRKIRII